MNKEEFSEIRMQAEKTMKRCQIGYPPHMIDDANDQLAECYGTIGRLLVIAEAAIDAQMKEGK